MARATLVLPDELMKEVRIRVIELYGSEKGAFGRAVADALRLWLKQSGFPQKKK